MWDWKQLKWMKRVGWDVYNEKKDKFGILIRMKGLFFFWIIPFALMGYVIHIFLSLRDREYSDTITLISELSTSTIATLKAFKWAYRGSEIKAIIKDIEELDKRRKNYFSNDNHTDSIIDDHAKVCSRYPYYCFVSLLGGLHWIMRPLTRAIQGEFIPVAGDWVPWDDTAFIGWIVHTIYYSTALVSAVGGMVAYDTLTLSYNEMTVGLIESISYGLSNLKFDDRDVRSRLGELHEMHRSVLEITKKVNVFTNLIIQADCLLFTLRMCCGVLEVTSDWTSSTKKINTIENCMVCAIFFYLQCYKCQIVTAKHFNVGVAAYDNDWYRGTTEEKRSLSIIILMSGKPVEFGSVIRINVSTFLSVMKTSFSYYNALKALEIR